MDIIQQLIKTLNSIHVSGEDDMSKLLGCINALRSVEKSIQAEKKSIEEKEKK